MALPHVVRFNAAVDEVAESYRRLAQASGIADGVEGLIERLSGFLDLSGLPRASAECGVDRARSADLAREAATQWTAQFNPRPVDVADFEQLFERLYQGEASS
jgi:alcohol dehydrogenase